MRNLIRMVLAACCLWLPLRAQKKDQPDKPKLSARQIAIMRRQKAEQENQAAAAYKNAETAFLVGEFDRAIEEFLSVAREHEETSFRMKAVLRVGDVYYQQKKYDRAVSYYQRALKVPPEPWWPEDTPEYYARADYMIGVCYFDEQALDRAFAHFRRFVQKHPESKWVDRAYDFIGRGNMAKKRFGQAIEAFRMVGTANLQAKANRSIAPGDDLYIRVVDEDVGLATREAVIPVSVTTTGGDRERVELKALGLGSPVFLGTIRTRLGQPRLTEELDSAFSQQVQQRLTAALEQAETAAAQGQEAAAQAAAMEIPAATEDNQQEIAALTKQKQNYEATAKRFAAAAEQLRQQAYSGLDAAFATVEKVLQEWEVDVDAPAPEQRRPEPGEEGEAIGEDAPRLDVSDVFTPDQIRETRARIPQQPTDSGSFKYRFALLKYWHEQLVTEFKTLDLNGADTIEVRYLDEHGQEANDAERIDKVTIAADASLLCVGQDLKSAVRAAILGDEVRVKVVDADADNGPQKDTVQVAVASIPKVVETDEQPPSETTDDATDDAEDDTQQSMQVLTLGNEEEEEKPVMVPEGAPSFTLTLTETGAHTGEFVGSFSTVPEDPAAPEAVLGLDLGKVVRVAYADKRTDSRSGDWVETGLIELVPAADGTQEVIEMQDNQMDRRSELEKGIALGKLGRVYLDLGLTAEAKVSFDEALKVVKRVVDAERGSALGEEATYQMWDLYFASGDEEAAAEACQKLIHSFPNSPLADDALLIMGKATKDKRQAVNHYQRLVQRYPDSDLAPEALYLLAQAKSEMRQFDVAAYEAVASKYPESNYAGFSLLELGEYFLRERDYPRSRDYLERIELDYPDFEGLDKVTYMRGICAYRLGDVQLSYTLMHEVIEKYPGTAAARSAAQIVPVLQRKLQR